MSAVCVRCGKRFHVDLRYCPHCLAKAPGACTGAWDYGMADHIDFRDPSRAYAGRYRKASGVLIILTFGAWSWALPLVDGWAAVAVWAYSGAVVAGGVAALVGRLRWLHYAGLALVLVSGGVISLALLAVLPLGYVIVMSLLGGFSIRGRVANRTEERAVLLMVLSVVALVANAALVFWMNSSTM
jgi:hypothetical protein